MCSLFLCDREGDVRGGGGRVRSRRIAVWGELGVESGCAYW